MTTTAKSTDPATAPSRWGRRRSGVTVRGWFHLVLIMMGILVAVGSLVGAHLLNRTTEVFHHLSDSIQPARAEAYRLETALVNQETGARGYAITADPRFLEPYTLGLREENEAVERLRELLEGHDSLLGDVREIEEAAARWRVEHAEPLIDGVVEGAPRALDPAVTEEGRVAFDRVRTLTEEQGDHLTAARDATREELGSLRTLRDAVLLTMVIAFFATGAAMTILLRALVIRPLTHLAAESRRVARGEFDRHIPAEGPADLRSMAMDVEGMRRRIVSELDASREQRERLERQTADLDARAVELRRSNAELEQFAYVASHDLQEPLRKVASFCQLLEKRYGDKLDDRGAQYIAFAVDGAKRMQVLINDLLTFSRVGRVNESRAVVELDRTLDKALANLSGVIEESGARIERPDRLPALEGDPTLLVMLWQNLIGNAVKFRDPDHPPEIRVTCDIAEDAGSLTVGVADNGIGIPEKFAEKVFVIFQRLHSRDSYSGTGIGLALCKKIVEYHGGRIRIDTGYTEGARFLFTLPLPEEAGEAPATPASVAAPTQATPLAPEGTAP
ncbi:sensor histidine kinase [Streptomyces alkaliphilus]|uniref:sensor histidine kinase n=1 Tax=Streptomyces alkaliphilus TaxID=1472722 RepID=UPI001180BCEA|nr:HAMP domain-containing protein [Streptomyces alkaliphilus]